MMLWFGRKKESPEFYSFFKNILGYTPRHTELYHVAFLHKSLSTVERGHRINNERLEYLGDAVLSAVVADYLYKKYPFQGEGYLTVLRSKIVSRASLNKLAEKTGLVKMVSYQHSSTGYFKSIGGDAFEALVGAMYLERGYRFTRKVIVKRVIGTYMDIDEVASSDWNYKSKLLDWGQKRHKQVQFELVRSFVQGHANRRQFECRVLIDGEPRCSAIDYSIKAAEQQAAEKTYKELVS